MNDIFANTLYDGNSTNPHMITTGIDLDTKEGLVWVKATDLGVGNILCDTVRQSTVTLSSNESDAEVTAYESIIGFKPTGFQVGTQNTVNATGTEYISWTFREKAKFFDIVSYSGDGVAGRAIPHNLASVPGMIMVKNRGASSTNWVVYSSTIGSGNYLTLNSGKKAPG